MPSAEQYRNASHARLEDARILADHAQWSGSIYIAGRATEAMLKSLLRSHSDQDDTGHSLRDMLKHLTMTQIFTSRDYNCIAIPLSEIARLWGNDLRFVDDDDLLRRIKRLRIDRGIKGNVLNTLTRRILEAAEMIVQRGEFIWNRSNHNSNR